MPSLLTRSFRPVSFAPQDFCHSFAHIRQGRQRAEKQRLADEILGRGRKNNTLKDGSRKPGTGPSLASRVGITKVCIGVH